jgi:hypothetical protein
MEKPGKTLVIGIGGAGKNVLEQMGADAQCVRLLINTDAISHECSSVEHKFFVDRRTVEEQPDLLPSVLISSLSRLCAGIRNVVVICGPRSRATAQILVSVGGLLIEFGCTVQTLLFAPFRFEPATYFHAAQDALESFQPRLSTSVIDLDNCLRLAPEGQGLADVLSQANQYAIDIALRKPAAKGRFGELLRKLSDRDLTRELGRVRLVCRVTDVWASTEEDSPGLPDSDARSTEIRGTMDCMNMFTVEDESPIRFNISRLEWAEGSPSISRPEAAMELAMLRRCAELHEAVIVSVCTLAPAGNSLDLFDPVIEPTGIPFELLQYLLSD